MTASHVIVAVFHLSPLRRSMGQAVGSCSRAHMEHPYSPAAALALHDLAPFDPLAGIYFATLVVMVRMRLSLSSLIEWAKRSLENHSLASYKLATQVIFLWKQTILPST